MIQCFVKKNFSPGFRIVKEPQLVYVSKIEEDASINPRVMHAHEDLVEIVLITSGTGYYNIGGKKHNIARGDLIIYNSNVVHDEPSGPNMRIGSYCCAFSGLQIEGMRENALLREDEKPVRKIAETDCSALERLLDLMFTALVEETAGGEDLCHHLLVGLITSCFYLTRGAAAQDSMPEENVLSLRIKNHIDNHYAEDISLQTISEELNISPYYLSHVFKDATGYSPVQYIVRRRIGEAQTLLISTKLSITQIASMVGYGNPSHFNLLFSKNVGMTPRQYRKNYIVEKREEGGSRKE